MSAFSGYIDLIKKLSSPLHPIETDLSPRLEKLSDIRAVIFDIYGTLFISSSGDISLAEEQDREDLMRQALEQSDFFIRDHSLRFSNRFTDTIKSARDKRRVDDIEFPEVEIRSVWREFLQLAKSNSILGGEITDESIEKIALTFEHLANPTWPMPGLKETLNYLQNQGLSLGIVSNAQFYTPLLFEALLGNNLEELGFTIDCCVWSYREREAKPSTTLFEKAAEALEKRGIDPGQTLYVGNDMLNDIRPALKSGFKTALFAGDKRSLRLHEDDPQCQNLDPDLVLTSLNQIRECLPKKVL